MHRVREETGIEVSGELVPLGQIVQKSGKQVTGFALAQDFDPRTLRSNTCHIEWPPRSGKQLEIAEIDRAAWFALEDAAEKINVGQRPFLDRLVELLQPDAVAAPMEIDGVLDLHTFSPTDVKELVLEYLAASRERGLTELRIIHGKGTGVLRTTVHALLERHPDVLAFRLAGEDQGEWGATIVTLRA
jgi:hypothetical protein